MNRLAGLTCALCVLALGCQRRQAFVAPEPSLERMLEQPRVDPFEGSSFYQDGMAMRPVPAGTVSTEHVLGPAKLILGLDQGAYADRIPLPVDRAFVEHGRERFEIFCAACHGISGEGASVVAQNMELRKPPSLHEDRIRAYPVGRLYRVIAAGFGLMPAYATQLSVEDRWAVVAYVEALQLSRNVQVAQLPEELRVALQKEAR